MMQVLNQVQCSVVYIFAALFYFVIAVYNPPLLGFNLSNWMCFLLLVVMFIFALKKSTFGFSLQVLISIFPYIFFLTLFLFLSSEFFVSQVVYLRMMLPIFVLFLLLQVLDDMEGLKNVSKIFGISCFIASVSSLLFSFFLREYFPECIVYRTIVGNEIVNRISGPYFPSNVLADYLVISLPFLWYLIRDFSFCTKMLMMGTVFFSIIGTFSRGGIIALIAGYICVYVTKQRHSFSLNSFFRGVLFWCLILSILVICTLFFSEYFTRTGSNDVRMFAIINAIDYCMDGGLFGYGLGAGAQYFDGAKRSVLDGAYINLLVDTGILGLFSYLFLLVVVILNMLKRYVKTRDPYYLCLLYSIFFFVFIGIFESILDDTLLNHVLAIYISALKYKAV